MEGPFDDPGGGAGNHHPDQVRPLYGPERQVADTVCARGPRLVCQQVRFLNSILMLYYNE